MTDMYRESISVIPSINRKPTAPHRTIIAIPTIAYTNRRAELILGARSVWFRSAEGIIQDSEHRRRHIAARVCHTAAGKSDILAKTVRLRGKFSVGVRMRSSQRRRGSSSETHTDDSVIGVPSICSRLISPGFVAMLRAPA